MGAHYIALALSFTQGIALVPLYLKYIPSDMFGYWLATGNAVAWMTMLDPGLADYVQHKIARAIGRRETDGVAEIAAAGLWVSALCAVLIVVLGWLSSNWIGKLVGVPVGGILTDIRLAYLISVAASAVMVVAFMFSAIAGGFQVAYASALLFNIGTAMGIVTTLVLLEKSFGVVAIAAGGAVRALLSLVTSAAVAICQLRRSNIRLRWSSQSLAQYFPVLQWNVVARGFGVIVANSDSIIVARVLGPQAVVLLNLTRRPIQVIEALLSRPAIAVMPSISNLSGGDTGRLQKLSMEFLSCLLWIVLFAVSGAALFNYDVVRIWIGGQYFAGHAVNVILAGACGFGIIAKSLSNLCWSLDNINGNLKVGVGAAIIGLVLLFVGSELGLMGVATALAIGQIVPLVYYVKTIATILEFSPRHWNEIMSNVKEVFIIGFAAVTAAVLIKISFSPSFWVEVAVYTTVFGCLSIVIPLSRRRRSVPKLLWDKVAGS